MPGGAQSWTHGPLGAFEMCIRTGTPEMWYLWSLTLVLPQLPFWLVPTTPSETRFISQRLWGAWRVYSRLLHSPQHIEYAFANQSVIHFKSSLVIHEWLMAHLPFVFFLRMTMLLALWGKIRRAFKRTDVQNRILIIKHWEEWREGRRKEGAPKHRQEEFVLVFYSTEG